MNNAQTGNAQPSVQIRFTSHQNHPLLTIHNPRKMEIKSPFGAQPSRCRLELYQEDNSAHVVIGSMIEVELNQTKVFKGYVIEKRIDSVDDQLSFVAMLDPAREWNKNISGMVEPFTVNNLLQDFISGTGLTWQTGHPHPTVFSKLTFSQDSLYFAIDLLAKLAGNWIWDVSMNGALRFRPHTLPPQHTVVLHPDRYTVNIRENHQDVYSWIEVECGIRDGAAYEKVISIPHVARTAQSVQTRIFARPVSTPDVYAALERSIMQNLSVPHYEHYVDLLGSGENVQPGDTVCFRVDEIPLFPQDQIFRVKQRDITYSHGQHTSRLHLTTGYESAPGYFYYLRSDRTPPPLFLLGKTGVFQLDLSALDSPSSLDAA